jgi:hypothetical protein
MTGSPVAALVRAWVDLYTRGLPTELRAARRDEVDDDLWCEQEDAEFEGRSGLTLGTDMALRLLFGIPADIGWRLTYRGQARADLERSSAMHTRTLGALALIGGLTFGGLFLLFVPFSHGVWEGTFGVWALIATFVGVAAFAGAGLGLVWQFQDRIGPLGSIGALIVVIGAMLSMGQSVVPLLVGLTALTAALARIGVISWLAPAGHLVSAIAGVWLTIARPDLDVAGTRALFVALMAPFIVSWSWMGVSLYRGPRLTPTTAASTPG